MGIILDHVGRVAMSSTSIEKGSEAGAKAIACSQRRREGSQDPAAISSFLTYSNAQPRQASRIDGDLLDLTRMSDYQELQHLVDVTIDRISSYRKRAINLLAQIKRVLSDQCGIPSTNIWFQRPGAGLDAPPCRDAGEALESKPSGQRGVRLFIRINGVNSGEITVGVDIDVRSEGDTIGIGLEGKPSTIKFGVLPHVGADAVQRLCVEILEELAIDIESFERGGERKGRVIGFQTSKTPA